MNSTNNKPLSRSDLMSLEEYAEKRTEFREHVMQHMRARRLQLGEHATVYFEDRLTIQYQVQEMLRIERIFEASGIDEELAAYNPLLPDGSNWKATFMIEYPDAEERKAALGKLLDIENRVWFTIGDSERIRPIADEDLDRQTETKTSAVHFLRIELSAAQVADLKSGAVLSAGIDHPHYDVTMSPVPDSVRQALIADLG